MKSFRILTYFSLTFAAVLLFIPMLWMTLGSFAPQTELQTQVPMGGMIKSLSWKTLTDPAEFRSWASVYLTTRNYSDPETKSGLFDITAMPTSTFRKAPVHAWFFNAAENAGVLSPSKPEDSLRGGRLILWFENTLFISVVVTVLSVFFNALAGYAFAKFDFPGREWLFWVILGSIMIPGQVTIIPLFLLVTRGLDWHDSMMAIILPQVAAPVGIFLMRQYMQGLPTALEEAARIDGCSEPGIFFRVILPLSKPILAVWAIFTFIGAWKGFLWPLIVTSDQNLYMLEVGLKTLQFSAGPRNVGVVMGAALLASIPMIMTFFLFQKYLTKGLTIGGVKG